MCWETIQSRFPIDIILPPKLVFSFYTSQNFDNRKKNISVKSKDSILCSESKNEKIVLRKILQRIYQIDFQNPYLISRLIGTLEMGNI